MGRVVFTSGSGEWTTPSGTYDLTVTLIGAGGGGGGSAIREANKVVGGGGGGGGACTKFSITTSPGLTWSYSVGVGGSGGTAAANDGGNGAVVGNPGSNGGETLFGRYKVSGGSPGSGGAEALPIIHDAIGGEGGKGGKSPSTIYDGGKGGNLGKAGVGLGAAIPTSGTYPSETGGGGGGLGSSANTIYSYVKNLGYEPKTYAPTSNSGAEGGKPGSYGTGGCGAQGYMNGRYGTGGKGGDGLIVIEYEPIESVRFTVRPTNCQVGESGTIASTRDVVLDVPKGTEYTVSSVTGQDDIRYKIAISHPTVSYFEDIYVLAMEGYEVEPISPSSATLNSNTVLNVNGYLATYTGTIYKNKYPNFKVNLRYSGFVEYTSNSTSFSYKMGDRIDVDWGPGYATYEVEDQYHRRKNIHGGTNKQSIKYYKKTQFDIEISDSGDANNLMGYNCVVNPDPKDPPLSSVVDEYRVSVTYDPNGGTLPSGTNIVNTEWGTSEYVSIELPPHPVKNNYIFKGWIKDNSTPTAEDDPDIYPWESHHSFRYGMNRMYAIWEGIDCSVTVIVRNYAYKLQNFPLIYGYWSNENEGEKANQMEIASRGTSKIPVKYNGRIWGEISNKYNGELRPDTVYESIVWDKDGKAISFPYQVTTTDAKIYLQLYPYNVTIKFYKNDGTTDVYTYKGGSDGNLYVYDGIDFPKYSDMNLGANSTDNTKVCIGWSTDASASIPDYADGYNGYVVESTSPGDVTVNLYAVWGEVVTVYFDPYKDSNSDTVYSIKTNPATGRLISTPPTPTPPDLDWAFSGWKCTQVSYFNTPRSSSEVAGYSFRGVGTELWFYGVYMQRKYYPVVFVDNLDLPASIAKCMKNEKPVLNWSDTIKTDNGENFNPSAKSWQPYQSSQIFEIGYSEQVKLNKIINVFYRSGAPNYSDDNIHMAISCGKYGIIDLGDIQDISDSYSAMLTTIPIAPFGYSGTFCMDRGVQRSLSVGIVRVSPVSPDDNNKDSRRWSNSKWISMLRAMTDRWQMMTDGVRLFMYVPNGKAHNVVALNSKYSLNAKGFINGGMTSVNAYISQLPLSYSSDSVHKISLSMTFRVGTIYPKPPVIKMTAVTLKVGSKTKVIQYPSNSYSALPRCPAELLDESSQIFIAWRIDTSTTLVYPGDPFIVGSNAMTLTAYYIDYNAGDCDVYTTEGSTTYTVTVGSGKTHVTICAIGGGGAGARGTSIKSIKQSQSGVTIYPLTAGGAGGGSGYLHARRISVAEGDKLYIKLGRGGQSYSASGERTVVSFDDANGKVIVSAKEGAGGTSSTVGGTGGAGYKSGGAGGYPYISKKSDYPNDVKYINSIDGSGAPGTFGLGGANDQNWAGGISYFWGGGGGGAAPPRVGKVEGMGGSGEKLKDSSRKMDGTFGGGGGGAGAVAGSFGKGGDGYVCLIWE